MLQPATIAHIGSPPEPVPVWTVEDVQVVMEAAGRQLNQTTDRDRRWIGELRCFWPETGDEPDTVDSAQWDTDMRRVRAKITEAELDRATWLHDPHERHRQYEDNARERVNATIADATALDAVLDWLWWLEPGRQVPLHGSHVIFPRDVSGIVIARACGESWRGIKRLRRKLGERHSHEQVRRVYRAALRIICDRLNREGD